MVVPHMHPLEGGEKVQFVCTSNRIHKHLLHVNTISNANYLVRLRHLSCCFPQRKAKPLNVFDKTLISWDIFHAGCTVCGLNHNENIPFNTSEKISCQISSPIKPPLVLFCLFPLAILLFITAYGTQAITCPLLGRKLNINRLYNLEVGTLGVWNDLFVTNGTDFTPVCNLD